MGIQSKRTADARWQGAKPPRTAAPQARPRRLLAQLRHSHGEQLLPHRSHVRRGERATFSVVALLALLVLLALILVLLAVSLALGCGGVLVGYGAIVAPVRVRGGVKEQGVVVRARVPVDKVRLGNEMHHCRKQKHARKHLRGGG